MSIEKTGKTVEEATAAALAELNLAEDQVVVEVLEKPKKGLFGIGKRDARVRVTPKDAAAEPTQTEPAETVEPEPAEAVQEPEGMPAVDATQAAFEAKVKEKMDAELGAEAPAEQAKAPAEADRNREFVVDEAVIEAAKEFLQKIFKAMDMQVVMEKFINKKDGCVVLKLHGADMGILIGKHGQTLDAFQYLTNLVANKNATTRMHIVIDVENYRERRAETLTRLARRLADKCKRTGERVVLEPMNPHERKIIHTALQNDPKVTTLSEGSEPFRKVVIELKK
ncbi:MAG: RNA-binding cell elongation regulator Jag/EloR [Succiniclasticum sp.]|jgi:spoIIIJ-associated protein|nr:RNA-binding cell elongation regulator Jag/EloR [Succiniclasticum sp.]MEE3479934.1 RNA-binding cell elongation regulator Jag/EloR [Succiniclasticum sp.]